MVSFAPPPQLDNQTTFAMASALRIALCILVSTTLDAQVLITEIMFDPVAGRGCEYVEIFNSSEAAVGLRNWRIVDATGKTQATLPRAASIGGGRYLVIAADSLIFQQFPWLVDSVNVLVLGRASLGLNATDDAVVLFDAARRTVDSLTYDADWHLPELDDPGGTSLERASLSAPSTSARNWSSCVARNGGTPGATNSIALGPHVADAEIDVDPPTVSPDADGYQDVTRISYRLPSRTARINMTVLDRHGRLIDRIVNNELSGPRGEVIWNGYDPNGMPLAPEIYIVRIEAFDPSGVGLVTAQTGIVVARR
jgi:hypothetical protein